ncbi:MAG TPA: nucleotide exchange factor GrpE [Acidimicrobiia bacterium]
MATDRLGGPAAPPPGTAEEGGPTSREGDDHAGHGQGNGDRVAELEHLAEIFEDQARRAMADLDNSHKRHARDLEQARADERANVAKQFLPLVDHLELALGHADVKPSVIVEGVNHVLAEAIEVLRRLGFPRIDQVGEPFDPARHEAVGAIHVDDAEPGTVVNVVRPGYGEGNRQLRPASVVVSTGRQ